MAAWASAALLLLATAGATSFNPASVVLRIRAQPSVVCLNLAEVRIYNAEGQIIPYTSVVMDPWWSSPPHPPEQCFDEVLSSICATASGHVDTPLEVEFEAGTRIATVVVVNRVDCCRDRAVGADVWVEEGGVTTWQGSLVGEQATYTLEITTTTRTMTTTSTVSTSTTTMSTTESSSTTATTTATMTTETHSSTSSSISSSVSSSSTSQTSTSTSSGTSSVTSSSTSRTSTSTSVTSSRSSSSSSSSSSSATSSTTSWTGTQTSSSSSSSTSSRSSTTVSTTVSTSVSVTQSSLRQSASSSTIRSSLSSSTARWSISTITTQSTSSGGIGSTSKIGAQSTSWSGIPESTSGGMAQSASSSAGRTSTLQAQRAEADVLLASTTWHMVSGEMESTQSGTATATSSTEGKTVAISRSTTAAPSSDADATNATNTTAPTRTSSTRTAKASALGSTTGFPSILAPVTATLSEALAAGQAAAAAFLAGNSSEAVVLATSAGALHLQDLAQAPPVVKGAQGTKALLPSSLLQGLPQPAALGLMAISKEVEESLVQVPGAQVAGGLLDISVYDAAGKHVKVALTEPMLFKLPVATGLGEGMGCGYLETEGGLRWSDKGVWRATAQEVVAAGHGPEGFWCWTTHMSIFAVIVRAVLSCTNLELLSGDALGAISGREAWWLARCCLLTFALVAFLLQVMLVGLVWEAWAYRLGRTAAAEQVVSLRKCFQNLLKFETEILKHRFAAFAVYARDVLRCMTRGRARLKNQILTTAVQRFLAVRSGVSVACVVQHCWSGGAWLDSAVSMPKTTLCKKLEFHGGGAEAVVKDDLLGHNPVRVLRRFLMIVAAEHPLLEATRVGAGSLTVGKRMTLQLTSWFGVLATNALIFSFSGELRGWQLDAACPIDPDDQLFIVVATLASMCINVLPNIFLLEVAKQVHGRPLWAFLFWALVACFLTCTGLVILAMLANLNTRDEIKWYYALEWAMSIKLFAMPMAQALRHTLTLEACLLLDRRCKPCQQFKVVMGLRHASERELSPAEVTKAVAVAKQAITVEGLVAFTALLGEKVMPDWDPASSTSEDVMTEAILPLCARPPPLEDYPVLIHVEEVRGLSGRGSQASVLTCSVLHLGSRKRFARPRLAEQRSAPAECERSGAKQRCAWSFEADVGGLEPTHALGFIVSEGDSTVGVACISMEEVLKSGGWRGLLPLYQAAGDEWGDEGFAMPPEVLCVPAHEVAGSTAGSEALSAVQARLEVAVRLTDGYIGALALLERQALKMAQPRHESEVQDDVEAMREKLFTLGDDALGDDSGVGSMSLCPESEAKEQVMVKGLGVSKAFCPERSYVRHGQAPAERMVVHSRKALFMELVSSVLADALGPAKENELAERLRDADFPGILELLRREGCASSRYWIDLFALDPDALLASATGGQDWHEALLSKVPSILRSLRCQCCEQAVRQVRAGKERSGTLTQLIVLDGKCRMLVEGSCLAEVMLARAVRCRQRLALHAEQLGTDFGAYLADEAIAEAAWTRPYLEDKEEVEEAFNELLMQAAMRRKVGITRAWSDLGLAGVVAGYGALQAGGAGDVDALDVEALATGN